MTKLYLIFFTALVILGNNSDTESCKPRNIEFIAMEYIGLSNHIYKVIITEDHIVGIEVNGYISVANVTNSGTTINRSDLHDPDAYINPVRLQKYSKVDMDHSDLLSINSRNFRIDLSDVLSLKLSKNKKIGMGYYPYSGRVILRSKKTIENHKKKRDLILIGEQNEQIIIEALKDKIDNLR